MVCPQRRIQMMHERDVGRVVQSSPFRYQSHAGENALCALMTLLCQKNLMALFVKREITGLDDPFTLYGVSFTNLLEQLRHNLVDGQIQVRVVLRPDH